MLGYCALASASCPAARTEAWRVAGLIASVAVFSSPTISERVRGESLPFVAVTMAFTCVLVWIVATWRGQEAAAAPGFSWPHPALALAALAALALVGTAAWRLVDQILWNPIDPYRSDMLTVVREAIRQLLKGRDPYALYHVPWEAPLPYGPMLWAPFVIPQVLHVDLRAVTVMGELFVPACCGLVAAIEAGRSRGLSACLWIILAAALAFNPDLMIFTAGGHTPSYWPLLPLFAALVAAERWPSAAFALALLVAGRSTMVALVPVFAIAVWHRGRHQALSACAIGLATLVALLVPFALWDLHAFWYGMVASYPRVIKQVVWPSNDGGAVHTIGITGWLLAHHLERYVEATQIAALLFVYALAWRALRRGARPLAWMGLALLTFSLTTLWPVFYIYFDVLLLLVSAAIAETLGAVRPRVLAGAWSIVLAGLALTVATLLGASASSYPSIDLGSPDGTRALYRGFSEAENDGARRFVRARALTATLVLPRRSAAPADIVVTGEPLVAPGGPPQAVTATLNGSMLGTGFANAGWQPLRFHAPRSAWQIGSNELQLSFSEAAFAVSRVDVVSPADEPSHR